MKALLLVLTLHSYVWAYSEYKSLIEESAFLAEVIKVESDFGFPYQTVRLTYLIPCNATVKSFIENKSDANPPAFPPELGVMLVPIKDAQCDPSFSPTLAHRIFRFRSYPGLRPRVLNGPDRINQLHYGPADIQ